MRRITLDWDRICRGKLCRRMKLVNKIFWDKRVVVRVSSGGKGYHVIVYGVDLNFMDVISLRHFLGDDLRRLMIDEYRKKKNCQTQVLFSEKRGRRARTIYEREAGERKDFKENCCWDC